MNENNLENSALRRSGICVEITNNCVEENSVGVQGELRIALLRSASKWKINSFSTQIKLPKEL